MSPQANQQMGKRNSGSLGLAKASSYSGHNLVSQSMQMPAMVNVMSNNNSNNVHSDSNSKLASA